ncbi:hypothetical protein [Leifsonia aquatica]|uniref:hypothetical protein n=1 Tax=Leifsonia aquatica TaxID=144185 RepID=UPI0037F65138
MTEKQSRADVLRVVTGGVSVITGVTVLILWAWMLTERGYAVDAANAVGYSLPIDYVTFGIGCALILAPPVVTLVRWRRHLRASTN